MAEEERRDTAGQKKLAAQLPAKLPARRTIGMILAGDIKTSESTRVGPDGYFTIGLLKMMTPGTHFLDPLFLKKTLKSSFSLVSTPLITRVDASFSIAHLQDVHYFIPLQSQQCSNFFVKFV